MPDYAFHDDKKLLSILEEWQQAEKHFRHCEKLKEKWTEKLEKAEIAVKYHKSHFYDEAEVRLMIPESESEHCSLDEENFLVNTDPEEEDNPFEDEDEDDEDE